jgi:hypothetical protein
VTIIELMNFLPPSKCNYELPRCYELPRSLERGEEAFPHRRQVKAVNH